MSDTFQVLLVEADRLHNRKSHDYASSDDPYGNYHFAGKLAKMFDNPDDAGFVGRLGEKLYRLANLENNGKAPLNESIGDTELDIIVITVLWMADRIDRRSRLNASFAQSDFRKPEYPFQRPPEQQEAKAQGLPTPTDKRPERR